MQGLLAITTDVLLGALQAAITNSRFVLHFTACCRTVTAAGSLACDFGSQSTAHDGGGSRGRLPGPRPHPAGADRGGQPGKGAQALRSPVPVNAQSTLCLCNGDSTSQTATAKRVLTCPERRMLLGCCLV